MGRVGDGSGACAPARVGFGIMWGMLRRRTVLGLLGGAVALRSAWGVPGEGEATGLLRLAPPTEGQPILDGSVRKGVFMDTGTGRPESGMFGNVRKYADGSPRFHEGIDIAPAQPWRRDRNPRDRVRAAADGLAVYINRCTQNPSLYGNYVVLTHPVAGFGEVYTLYAHLRVIAEDLRAGQRVRAGRTLGVMGHTPDFPLARAHLHFELGVVMNRHYPMIDPQHGVWNGANLYGIDPCVAFAEQRAKGGFDVASYLRGRRAAWVAEVPPGPLPDFFRRYPALWRGEHRDTWPMAVRFSYEGIPLAGRCLPPGAPVEQAWLRADPAELRKGRDWSDPKRGAALLENLLASPARPPKPSAPQGEVG